MHGELREKPALLHVQIARRQERGGKQDPGGPGRPAGWRAPPPAPPVRNLACRLSPSCVLQEARQRQWARRDRWETEWASGHARRGRDTARSTHTRNSIRAEAVEELGPRHLVSDRARGTGGREEAPQTAPGFLAGNVGAGGVGSKMETRG